MNPFSTAQNGSGPYSGVASPFLASSSTISLPSNKIWPGTQSIQTHILNYDIDPLVWTLIVNHYRTAAYGRAVFVVPKSTPARRRPWDYAYTADTLVKPAGSSYTVYGSWGSIQNSSGQLMNSFILYAHSNILSLSLPETTFLWLCWYLFGDLIKFGWCLTYVVFLACLKILLSRYGVSTWVDSKFQQQTLQ